MLILLFYFKGYQSRFLVLLFLVSIVILSNYSVRSIDCLLWLTAKTSSRSNTTLYYSTVKPRDISYNHGCSEKGAHLANYKLLDTLVTLLQQQVETRGRYLGQLGALVSPWSPAAHISLTHPPLTEYSVMVW